MEDEILDQLDEAQQKQTYPFFYRIGNLLIFASFTLFLIYKWALISLGVCLIGTLLLWFSPNRLMDKLMATIPLIGFIVVLYSYARLSSILQFLS